MIKFIKRYKLFLLFFTINIVLLIINPQVGKKSMELTKANITEMMSVIPAVFILLGLLDVWVERETMMKYMGYGAGIKGAVLAFLMGSAAAGPLYAAFPIAAILLKKGVRLSNVFIFIGAWSTTKIPMLLFETSNLGWRFMVLRLVCNMVGIVCIAFIIEKTTKEKEKEALYLKAQKFV